MATNKAFQAQYDDTCHRCHKSVVGYQYRPKSEAHWINLFNFPKPKTVYHVDCDNPLVSPYSNSTDEPEVTSVTPTPEPSNGNGNGHANSVEQAIRDLVETIAPKPQTLDMATIAKVIKEEVDKAVEKTTRRVVIEDRTRHVEVKIETAHEKLEELTALVEEREPVLLWGDSGSGKSETARMIANALGLPFYYISLAQQTPEYRIMGTPNANGEYIPTPFFEAYKNGGVFCIDEVGAASDNLMTSLNSALANGHASFPVVGMVERHANFICICTDNTPLLGANPVFTSRRPQDGATRERFTFLEWNTDQKLERELTLAINPKAETWVTWVQAVRAYSKTNFPKLLVTMRASMKGAKYLKRDIWTVGQIAEMVLFKGIDKDSVNKILAANPLPKAVH